MFKQKVVRNRANINVIPETSLLFMKPYVEVLKLLEKRSQDFKKARLEFLLKKKSMGRGKCDVVYL